MKACLVHDDFCQLGGAERLFEEIAKIYPEAPIYTSLVNWSKIPIPINPDRIHTSFIQKIPYAAKLYKILLPFYPLAFESFDFSGFDLVISSTTRFAKSIVTKPSTVHISYVNSIPRFLYNQDQKDQYLPTILRFILKPYFSWLKRWDKTASSRVDFYVANSQNIAAQIKNVYGREAEVVYPAVDTDFFQNSRKTKKSGYYLVVSRLVKWKKIDIAIEACQQLGVNLKIVGKGPDVSRLNKLSGKGIEFIDNATSEELKGLYQNAKALIVTQEEDFGISMVEALACGTGIIAYGLGGSREIVVDGKSGVFFSNQAPKSLKDAINRHSKLKWESTACRKSALRFSRATFRKNLTSAVSKYAVPNH